MLRNSFETIQTEVSSVQLVVEKSKFLAFACSVETTEQANAFFQTLKKKYFDATHICYAFLCDEGQKFSDGGEPQATAGMPILEAIKQKKLHNVAVAVVRYFGGTKLGAGGLIRAYSASCCQALDASKKIKVVFSKQFHIKCEYAEAEVVKSFLEKHSMEFEVVYENVVIFSVFCEKEKSDEFVLTLNDFLHGKIDIKFVAESRRKMAQTY